jgi:hypothetical protein
VHDRTDIRPIAQDVSWVIKISHTSHDVDGVQELRTLSRAGEYPLDSITFQRRKFNGDALHEDFHQGVFFFRGLCPTYIFVKESMCERIMSHIKCP